MKSIILYYQEHADSDHQAITLPDGTQIFIRAEIVNGNTENALWNGTPLSGEIILNTVPHPAFK